MDEQLLGAIRRAGSAVGSAVGGAVQKVGSALKAKPIVRKPGQTSVRTRGGGAPQEAKPQQQQQKQPAPQAQQTQQTTQQKPVTPAPKMGRTEIANREKLGNARVDALKAKNQEFQAAKKSGNLKQFRADNPKLSGRERAQAMAKARIAARNAQSNSPTAQKPTVDKVPPAAGGQKAAPAGTPPPQNNQSSGGGASASKKIDGASLANTMKNQKNQSGGEVKTTQASQSGNTSNSGGLAKDTKFATDKLLNTNKKKGKYTAADAKAMQDRFNARMQAEPDFDSF